MRPSDDRTKPEPGTTRGQAPAWSGSRALLERYAARAVGFWRCQDSTLWLEDFTAAGDMPPAVASGFVEATSRVPLDRLEFGIVRATVERQVVEIGSLPSLEGGDEAGPVRGGSPAWLAAFGSNRSVSVPLLDADNRVWATLAIALTPACSLHADELASQLREQVSPDDRPG